MVDRSRMHNQLELLAPENSGTISAVIQPGGAKKDADVIARADELGLAMIFTGTRHFNH